MDNLSSLNVCFVLLIPKGAHTPLFRDDLLGEIMDYCQYLFGTYFIFQDYFKSC